MRHTFVLLLLCAAACAADNQSSAPAVYFTEESGTCGEREPLLPINGRLDLALVCDEFGGTAVIEHTPSVYIQCVQGPALSFDRNSRKGVFTIETGDCQSTYDVIFDPGPVSGQTSALFTSMTYTDSQGTLWQYWDNGDGTGQWYPIKYSDQYLSDRAAGAGNRPATNGSSWELKPNVVPTGPCLDVGGGLKACKRRR